MISGRSSSCGIEQKFTWHICGWWNSTWNMVAAVSLPRGNSTSTATLLGISLAIQTMQVPHLPFLQFHERTWLSVCTCNQGLVFPLFSSEWNTKPIKSNNHPLLWRHFILEWLKIQHYNYSSLHISLLSLSCSECHVQFVCDICD